MPQTILIADGEPDIRSLLRLYLENAGYATLEAADGQAAVDAVAAGGVDLVLLDIMMPVLDGYEALRQIRATGNVPVILVSAKGQDPERILGLNLGADDYLAKPFNPLEVVARVGAVLRVYARLGAGLSGGSESDAGAAPATPPIRLHDLVLSLDEATLTRAGQPVPLTPVELRMMELFMAHPGRVFTKQQIFEHAWQEPYVAASNSVMVGVSKLRSKLADDPQRYIQTIRGIGYRMGA